MRLRSSAITVAFATAVAGLTIVGGLGPLPAEARPAPAAPSLTARPSVRPAVVSAIAARARTRDGVITGVIAGAHNRPLTGACVIAVGPAGSSIAMTARDGRYVLAGLRPGQYKLHFSDCSDAGRYLDKWSGGAASPQGAVPVAVAVGQVRDAGRVTLRSALPSAAPSPAARSALLRWTRLLRPRSTGALRGASAGLVGTGAIAGTVTGHGKPLHGICVVAYANSFGQAVTAKTGKYLLSGLRPGRYIVSFSAGPGCDAASNWLPQTYKDVMGFFPTRRPTPVRVTAGHTVHGIDAALQLGGEIAGTVHNAAGKALAGICVLTEGTIVRRHSAVGFATLTSTRRDGSYAAHSLFAAKYRVQFYRGCGNGGNYAPQWWRDEPTMSRATPIAIRGPMVVRHVDAKLATGASVSGVVRATNALGTPLPGICVFANPEFAGPRADAVTRSNGSYRLVGMTTGRYAITFSRCRNNGNYLDQTRQVRVTTGKAVTGFDAFLQPGATISGTVTDVHGAPVGGVCVMVNSARGGSGATTATDGTYSINALPTGSYTVQFTGGCGNSGSYAPQFYNGQTNQAAADPVALTAGQTTTGINATMQPGATISGTVAAGVHPLSGFCVAASSASQLAFATLGAAGSIAFTTNGGYTMRNLVPGEYAVSFGCFGGSRTLAGQWFLAQASASRADFVSAPPGVVTSGVDAVLRPGGFITGAVKNRAGKGLSGVCVLAVAHGSPFPAIVGIGSTLTNGKGSYRIGPLTRGSYDVQFVDCIGTHTGYGGQWYRASLTRASATPVRVRQGATTSGIGAVLTPGGSVSGLVTRGAGLPLRHICVTAFDQASELAGTALTDRHGHYTISGLASGSYLIDFSDCFAGGGRYASLIRPRAIRVIAPHAVTGVNEQLSVAGQIAGVVLASPSGRPQSGVCVEALPANPDGSFGLALTGPGGAYHVRGLGAGTYQVFFGDPFCPFGLPSGPALAPQWYNDQPSQSTANQVNVSAGAVTGGVSATLAPDGGISGTVTNQSSSPVPGECVTAVPVSPAPDPLFGIAWHDSIAVTASDGTYSLVSLPPGQYKVRFSVGCGDTGFADQWWNGAATAATATVITVSASATVPGIDATLSP
jgi:hypothetical protein